MVLWEQGHHGTELPDLRAQHGAARFFENRQKGVADERVVGPGTGVPLIGRKLSNRAGNPGFNLHAHAAPAPSAIGASAWAAPPSTLRTFQAEATQ